MDVQLEICTRQGPQYKNQLRIINRKNVGTMEGSRPSRISPGFRFTQSPIHASLYIDYYTIIINLFINWILSLLLL